jgi:SulP family sulfate permease
MGNRVVNSTHQSALHKFRINPIGLGNFRGDLFGGVTAAIVALPLAIAFGVASGAGAVAGLYGAICVGAFASLFGGTPAQISGPTGPMTIVSASVFTMYAGEPAAAFTVVMMAGAFQIMFGVLRLGRFVNLMPYPVISGFMTGIGCILIIMQIEPLLGYSSPASVTNAISVLPEQLSKPNWQAVAVGLASLSICVLTPKRITRVLPAPLLALAGAMLLATAFDNVSTIGAVPSGLPTLHLPAFRFDQLNGMLVSAAVLAALGSIDSLLTSLAADNVTRTYHDSDKELVGQGIGNFVAGMVGGLPGAGATIRTLTNVNAGGRTPVAGVIHSLVLLVIVLGFGSLVSIIPEAALSGILIKVGIDVIDWRYVKRMLRAPRIDSTLMLVVLFLTVFVDVVTAVATGVILASLMFVKESAEMQIESIRALSDPEHAQFLKKQEMALFRRCKGRLMFLHFSGLMSFGAAKEMTRRFSIVGTYDILIIDLQDVPRIDGSATLALEEIVERASGEGKKVLLAGLSAEVARLMSRMGVIDKFHETYRFPTRREALEKAVQFVENPD